MVFHHKQYIEVHGKQEIPFGLSAGVEVVEGVNKSPYARLETYKGYLFIPDGPTDYPAPNHWVELQSKYHYTKAQELQTVRVFLYLTIVHVFSDKQWVILIDDLTQTGHAMTCSWFLNTFLDDAKGTPNFRDLSAFWNW